MAATAHRARRGTALFQHRSSAPPYATPTAPSSNTVVQHGRPTSTATSPTQTPNTQPQQQLDILLRDLRSTLRLSPSRPRPRPRPSPSRRRCHESCRIRRPQQCGPAAAAVVRRQQQLVAGGGRQPAAAALRMGVRREREGGRQERGGGSRRQGGKTSSSKRREVGTEAPMHTWHATRAYLQKLRGVGLTPSNPTFPTPGPWHSATTSSAVFRASCTAFPTILAPPWTLQDTFGTCPGHTHTRRAHPTSTAATATAATNHPHPHP